VGIDEDPVNGSSHTVLGPYWASRGLGLRSPEGSDAEGSSGAEGSCGGGGAEGSSGAKGGGSKGGRTRGGGAKGESVTLRSRVCYKSGGDLRVTVPTVPLTVLGQAPIQAIKARRNERSPGDLWQVRNNLLTPL
jgi:hypothetical protein